ncbi:DUF4003 family protein [Salipaludibacillus keqinensis]|uniref:DUF4003 family protein n=1 Tax=Salipaludibacillus keqinensis TaxID=2045207 RepID=UPI001304950D|nr:DUF4003 family protein [Salipaludibacillus keqinensis]
MSNFNRIDILKEYMDIYKRMRSKHRWQVNDQRTLMIAASFYVVNDSAFHLQDYSDLTDYIKKKSPLFTTMRSYQRFTTAAMLDQRFDHPKEKYLELTDLYEQLVKGGFKRGTFTYIAALVMLAGDSDNSSHKTSIERSLSVYKGMKQHHPFITSKNDYPLSVLLAQLDQDIEPLMNHIEHFYRELNQNGFRKGNDLQFLSHILSIETERTPDDLTNSCVSIWEEFKRRKVKIKPMHYPEIGLLALAHASSDDLNQVEHLVYELNRMKWFKWHRDMNTIMATNFVVREKVDQNELIETGIFTTMETIIQAQQTAMIAAVAGGSAAATNGSNN